MKQRPGSVGDPKYASVADYWYHWQIVCCHLVRNRDDATFLQLVLPSADTTSTHTSNPLPAITFAISRDRSGPKFSGKCTFTMEIHHYFMWKCDMSTGAFSMSVGSTTQ